MSLNRFDRVLLLVIAGFLGAIAVRPVLHPPVVSAQSGARAAQVYIEPRTYIINSPDKSQRVQGKIVVDLTNGNIWGFPTLNEDPYPIDTLKNIPPTSRPIYLGKFDFSAMTRSE